MAEIVGRASESERIILQEGEQSIPASTSPWNSLEVSKLAASVLLPLVLLLLGVVFTKSEKHVEALIDLRIKSYDSMKADINHIHCYINDIGTWKEDTPETITGFRRDAERELHEDEPIWSEKTVAAFTKFMDDVAFKTNTGAGKDAQVRTSTAQKSLLSNWNRNWTDRFAEPARKDEYDRAYKQMIDAFGYDIKH